MKSNSRFPVFRPPSRNPENLPQPVCCKGSEFRFSVSRSPAPTSRLLGRTFSRQNAILRCEQHVLKAALDCVAVEKGMRCYKKELMVLNYSTTYSRPLFSVIQVPHSKVFPIAQLNSGFMPRHGGHKNHDNSFKFH